MTLYDRVRTHSDETIGELDLDAPGHFSWWGEHGRPVTLGLIMIHVTTETHRNAGHADLLRELIDGVAGFRTDAPNLPEGDLAWWARYRGQVGGERSRS